MVILFGLMTRRKGGRPSYLVTLGERIRLRRKARGLTRERLAERVGISLTSLAFIERGDNEPSLVTLLRICGEIEVAVGDLLAGLSLPPM
jgi:transcriptional regulator with XRE-family HTH domain